ncbi:MAG: DUF2069 domain-containing protein [Gammaproteobacteria bacterium]|nr:DUF2069 domain-containing protein [Gammaproteobacteria bacterium]
MTRLRFWRWVTLIGYFSLLLLLLNWFTWYSPPKAAPRSLVLILVVVPLLLPMRGLLYERRRTHQWANFLALPYFAMGVDYAFNSETDGRQGLLVIVFSLLFWTGCIMFAKYSGPPRPKKTRKATE